jgi:hypothetical protein
VEQTAQARDLQLDQVQTINSFSDRVLNLQAGICFDEPELIISNKKFNGAQR